MKRRARLVISAASGIIAVLVALAYASSVQAEAEQERKEALARFGGDMVEVCVATRDIEPGETIDEGNVAVEEWVASFLPNDAQTSFTDVYGKTATSRIPKRAVLCPDYFEANEGAVEVPSGMVAVSVSADEAHALGGLLARGDSVDVYVSLDGVADLLCQASVVDTSVLAEDGESLSWVTLAVDPTSVRELLIASSRAQVTLVAPGAGVTSSNEGDGA